MAAKSPPSSHWCSTPAAKASPVPIAATIALEMIGPMPGTVIAIQVAEGDMVSVGQPLMVIESMKLETTLLAPREARVKAVHFGVGATFRLKAILLTLTDA